ncbi:hypothetical protein [Neoasaia chiangmaiensis]|nr:hypothetical protein [Neoasaia chiangmaiensis]
MTVIDAVSLGVLAMALIASQIARPVPRPIPVLAKHRRQGR